MSSAGKYILLGLIFLYFLAITILVDVVFINTLDTGVGFVGDIGFEDNAGFFDLVKVYWRLLSFRVEELPAILNFIFVYPVTIIMIAIIIDLIRG